MENYAQNKLSARQIQEKFDQRVEAFSNSETGQQTALDSLLMMEMIAAAASHATPHAVSILDIGCGAGNYTLKVLEACSTLDCTLLDISRSMLERAELRVSELTTGQVRLIHGDVREVNLPAEQFDIVVSGTALHHLRTDEEWEQVFQNVYRALTPGGGFWISDLVCHEHPEIEQLMRNHYGSYLEASGGPSFRERVFESIQEEDTPRSVEYQVNLLEKTGFTQVTILHKHACFAAFGGIKN